LQGAYLALIVYWLIDFPNLSSYEVLGVYGSYLLFFALTRNGKSGSIHEIHLAMAEESLMSFVGFFFRVKLYRLYQSLENVGVLVERLLV
jgi:hypothetical protein